MYRYGYKRFTVKCTNDIYEYLDMIFKGRNITKVSEEIGMTRQNLHRIIRDKKVTIDVLVRISHTFKAPILIEPF